MQCHWIPFRLWYFPPIEFSLSPSFSGNSANFFVPLFSFFYDCLPFSFLKQKSIFIIRHQTFPLLAFLFFPSFNENFWGVIKKGDSEKKGIKIWVFKREIPTQACFWTSSPCLWTYLSPCSPHLFTMFLEMFLKIVTMFMNIFVTMLLPYLYHEMLRHIVQAKC